MMSEEITLQPKRRTFQTAVDRWAGVGPYYAMFPVEFAFDVVKKYTEPGDQILDPFVGRGTSIYAAGASNRQGCGIEINPVGWVYSTVKLRPVTQGRVISRLREIGRATSDLDPIQAELPEFFEWAYTPHVLQFLLRAREHLRWRHSRIDATLMAFILVYLHGRRSSSLSNQTRDSKAMAPDYSVRWWKERNMHPPEVDPVPFLEQRIEWRYKKGRPELSGTVHLGDSINILASHRQRRGFEKPFDLLFTSPPYYDVTNYHYDQWLRLWMLGGPNYPKRQEGRWQKKFESQPDYRTLLKGVFGGAAPRMRKDAVAYIRTDARPFTFNATIEALQEAFPNKNIQEVRQPFRTKTQTALYGDSAKKPGEVDLILTPR